jgi:hypothetical protein
VLERAPVRDYAAQDRNHNASSSNVRIHVLPIHSGSIPSGQQCRCISFLMNSKMRLKCNLNVQYI